MNEDHVTILLGGGRVLVNRDNYMSLFDNSIISRYRSYQKTLETNKIAFLKRNGSNMTKNSLQGSLKSRKLPIEGQAQRLRDIIGLDINYLRLAKTNKTKAFAYIAALLEKQNVFVAQSTIPAYMPQTIHPNVKFSGICVRDKMCPFIFLNNKDNSSSYEPEGRRVLTLVLLAVCLAKLEFGPVSYSENAKDLIDNEDYAIAEEVLMPCEEIRNLKITSLKSLKEHSDIFCVTPSALLMRLRRLKLVKDDKYLEYSKELSVEFRLLKKPRPHQPGPVTGFRKYNGESFSRIITGLVGSGSIARSEGAKVLFQNKFVSTGFFEEYRGSL